MRLCPLDTVTLLSDETIICPDNAFDEQAYRHAVLRVPKGWKKNTGQVWERFRIIRHY